MKRINILSSAGIGDVIILGPLVGKLKKTYPRSKVTIYSFRGGYLRNLSICYVDEIVRLDSFKKLFRFFKEKADILINPGYCFKNSSFFKIISYYLTLWCPKVDKKIFHGLELPEFQGKNLVQIKLDVLKKLNIEIAQDDYDLFIPFSFLAQREKIERILRENKINPKSLLVGIHAGTKEGYFTRFWPVENWIKTIEYLKKRYKAEVFFVGGKNDVENTRRIIEGLNFPVLNLEGRLSIKETTALINKCGLFISTNSGPMWLAAALHKPQIALCGPSKHPWEPYNKRAIVIRKIINRKYCNPPCDAKKCKYGDVLCMKSLGLNEVKKAIDKIIREMK